MMKRILQGEALFGLVPLLSEWIEQSTGEELCGFLRRLEARSPRALSRLAWASRSVLMETTRSDQGEGGDERQLLHFPEVKPDTGGRP